MCMNTRRWDEMINCKSYTSWEKLPFVKEILYIEIMNTFLCLSKSKNVNEIVEGNLSSFWKSFTIFIKNLFTNWIKFFLSILFIEELLKNGKSVTHEDFYHSFLLCTCKRMKANYEATEWTFQFCVALN